MKIEKLTEEYTLKEVNGKYTLDFGTITYREPVTVTLLFTDIKSSKFTVNKTCGCTTVENKVIDGVTYESKITYNAATKGDFNKTTVITNNRKKEELKLIGTTV